MDEPTSGMDPFARQGIWDVLKEESRTIIFSTHIWEEAEKYADRVAFLDQGEILSINTPSALLLDAGLKARRKVKVPKIDGGAEVVRGECVLEEDDAWWVYPPDVDEFVRRSNGAGRYAIFPVSLEDVFLLLRRRRAAC